MTAVEWPPEEKVRLIGSLSRPEAVGVGVATVMLTVGIATGRPLAWAVLAVPVLGWTLVRFRGVPVRTQVLDRLRWVLRRDRDWQSTGASRGDLPPCLAGVRVLLAEQSGGPVVGVVECATGSSTVAFGVDAGSPAFESDAARSARLESWGAVLSATCVEPGTVLAPERIAWTDLHRALDPAMLAGHHAERGRPGPAAADYASYVAGFASVAAAHRVVVSVTLTRARSLRLARAAGYDGPPSSAMAAATIAVGRRVAADLAARGFQVGRLLSPPELGRLLAGACDPFEPPPGRATPAERFGLPERIGPERVHVERHQVVTSGAIHRAFAVRWPRIAVDPDWLGLPLALEGPQLVTTVLEPVAPSRAEARREALTTRGEANNALAAAARGRVRTIDRRKTDALHAAERAVAAGHQELDGWAIIVVAARTADELERRCRALHQRMREAGRAGLLELAGRQDRALVAALPLGLPVTAAVE